MSSRRNPFVGGTDAELHVWRDDKTNISLCSRPAVQHPQPLGERSERGFVGGVRGPLALARLGRSASNSPLPTSTKLGPVSCPRETAKLSLFYGPTGSPDGHTACVSAIVSHSRLRCLRISSVSSRTSSSRATSNAATTLTASDASHGALKPICRPLQNSRGT